MKQYGDITKIKGSETPLVDIITGGSPCQDLSIAGKRAGLDGERSGLFMEQIRIIKEQRNESIKRLSDSGSVVDFRCVQPRYMVWENVPGAFSSNNGEDFRCVLEEISKVADKNAHVPELEKGQRWANAGCIMGDGYSVAWRLHDAQYWGVPQRRKRICVLADYGGDTAPTILFELLRETEYTEANKAVTDIGTESESEVQSVSESLSGHTEQGAEKGQGTSKVTTDSVGESSSYTLKIRGGCDIDSHGKKAGKGALVQTELSGTLGVSQDQTLITNKSGNIPMVVGCDLYNQTLTGDNAKSLTNSATDSDHVPCVVGCDLFNQTMTGETASTVTAACGGTNTSGAKVVCYGLDRASFNQGQNAKFGFSVIEEQSSTITAKGPGGVLAKQ